MNIIELSEYFDVKIDKIAREIKEQDVLELVVDYYKIKSVKEEKFYNFLKTKHPTLKCIRNDRKVLDGKELDFYFPEKKVAVEISPTRTHNTIRGFADGPGVDKDYHKNKFIECEKKGIELITIFDWYDWEKSLEHIQAKLKMLPNKIYANTTEYFENKYSTEEILEKSSVWSLSGANTIHENQNKIKSGVLEYNNEILGIILWVEENKVAIVNQIIFKPYTLIVGGVSKLLKNLIRNNPEIKSIETMSSSNLGSGFTYEKLGFTLVESKEEQLNYYSEKYKTHISQLSENKLVLIKKKPIIINHKNIGKYSFLPVYDCGYKKWSLKVN